jgi:putative transcriptional regulator
MNVLRDLRESTQVLFLHEVSANRHTRLRSIAERLGMTVQGAADYAHRLEAEGLLVVADGEYRATKRGVQYLQLRLRELRSFVEQAGRSMAFVETTAALAGTAARRGDRLGLFMEDGYLVAYPNRPSTSTGVAAEDASKGDRLAVRGLEGIVDLRPGRVSLVRIGPASLSAGRNVTPSTRKVLQRARHAAVATMDVPGLAAARRLGLRTRIEFGVIPAVIEVAERGMNVVLFLPEEHAAEALQAIEEENAKLEDKIPYESLTLA